MTDDLRPMVAAQLTGGLTRMQQDTTRAKPHALALRAALRLSVHGSFGANARADAALLGLVRVPVDDDGEPPPLDARLGRLLDDASLVAGLVAATRVRVHAPYSPDGTPAARSRRSLGRDLRSIKARRTQASDDLLTAMLRAGREQLPRHLRRALSLMADDEASVDAYALLMDLEHWDAEDHWVQKRWAYHFWSQLEARDRDDDHTDKHEEKA